MPPKRAAASASLGDDSGDDLAGAGFVAKKTVARKVTGTGANKRAAARNTAKDTAPNSKSKRAPLKDTTNIQHASDTEEVDEFDEDAPIKEEDDMPPRKTTTATSAKTKKPGGGPGRGRPRKNAQPRSATSFVEVPETQPADTIAQDVQQEELVARTNKQDAHRARKEHGDAMELDVAEVAMRPPSRPEPPRHDNGRPRSASTQRSHSRVRGSSHKEAVSDASAQRKIADLTKKLEALQIKYDELRDVGLAEADASYDNFRRASEDRAKAADSLISSLRKQLAEKTIEISSASTVRVELDKAKSRAHQAESDADIVRKTLQNVQTENKTLQTKLAATRSASATTEFRLPGSAMNNPRVAGQAATKEAQKEAQKQLLKEDLYGDLTGLLIRDVRRDEERGEDVFDCIQTGRNGTLRFYLTVTNPAVGGKPPADYSYDSAEFAYAPVLDTQHDMALISILPDYLTEEICFTRNQAAKFYARIQDCMTKKVEIVAE